jgi:alpha-glucosidase
MATNFDQYCWINSLATDVTEEFLSSVETKSGIELTIKIAVAHNDDVSSITLYSLAQGDELKVPLAKKISSKTDWWELEIYFENDVLLKPFSYRFKICTYDGCFFLDANGLYKYNVSNASNFIYFYKAKSPSWLTSAIVYHIFVDSFKKQLPYNEKESIWSSAPSAQASQCYGGDLYGIVDRLDYLTELGVNVICLTPIFTSPTNHKYDVEDYFSVDEKLGGNAALIALSSACKQKNIKIILDGVFNHVSGRSAWFNKDGLHAGLGAYHDIHSEYADFFKFNQHPENYESFWGDNYLPKLNYASSNLRNIIYKSENSILKHWMKTPYDIDGWRLDACGMIGKYNNLDMNAEVLSCLYAEAKNIKKECYVLGEYPFDPSEASQYKHVDGITNYAGFYSPLIYWLDEKTDFNVADFEAALREFRVLKGTQFTKSCNNFIGNHDKNRLMSVLGGDIEKYCQAIAFLFTYPGVPSLYYGEEIGLTQYGVDNDSRISMNWNSWDSKNEAIFTFTKAMISIYTSQKAIQKGSFKSLSTANNIYIYERSCSEGIVIVVLNNANTPVDSVKVICHSLERLNVSNINILCGDEITVSKDGSNHLTIKNIKNRMPMIFAVC